MEEALGRVKEWLVQARAPPVAPGGPLDWVPNSDACLLINDILASSHSAAEAIQRYVASFSIGAIGRGRRLHERAVDWLLADLHRRGCDLSGLADVAESPLFEGIPAPKRAGRRLTADLLVLLSFALAANQQLFPPTPGQFVLEVGGCYGELARLLALLGRNRFPTRHVFVDVPEGLAMSYLFLSQTFPGEPILLGTSEEQVRNADLAQYRFTFVPVALAAAVARPNVDLLVSMTALGGPLSTGLTSCRRFVQDVVRPRKILVLDRFLNTVRPGLAPWSPASTPSVGVGAAGYNAAWEILDWEIEPSCLRCPCAPRLVPRCVQVLARRTAAPDPAAARAMSRRLQGDVEDSIWARHFDGGALEGTCWDNQLIHDGGMGGATFKLWESIRLETRPENVRLMIQHLDQLQRFEGKLIEETPLYEELLARLVTDSNDRARHDEFVTWMCDRLRERTDPAAMTNYLRVILPELRGKRIVCYGIGRDFEAMVATGLFNGSQVVALIDDRRPPGSDVAGFKVVATADLPALQPDVILATSSRFGATLRERAAGIVSALGLKAQVR